MYDHDADDFLPVEECAARMGITVGQVDDLVRRGALRARRDGWMVLVQPAITNVVPRSEGQPEDPSPKRSPGTAKTRPHNRKAVRDRK